MNNFDERRKEFQRQQDRLKMMAPDSERRAGLLSADAMIDSLLQKSETFRKTTELPQWLKADAPLSCQYYEKIWEIVRANEQVVDTPRVSQLLLTSGLHPDILGYIWNLANKTSPGQLTKQELYVVLALVGLAQSGCTFNDLSVLNLVPSAPMPRLHVPFQPVFNRPQPTLLSSPTIPAPHLPPQTPVSLIRHPSHQYQTPLIEEDMRSIERHQDLTQKVNEQPAPIADESDDFADFQSADIFDTSVVQPSVKLSSFIKVSPESERKLRNLSQPESLAALPESKISSKNQVSSVPSILSASRSVGSRLANHSLQEKAKKHLKIKSDDLFGKCLPKSSTFLLKETKIPSIELDENTRKIEIPSVGTFKETILPVERKKNDETLLSMEEDKYGALRELESNAGGGEDFGDFLSADLPSEKAVEAWNTWNQSVHETPTKIPDISQSVDLLGDSFDLGFRETTFREDDFGEFVAPDTGSVKSFTLSCDLSLAGHESWSSLEINSEKKMPDGFEVGEKCLMCCRDLLSEALAILKHLDGVVLNEVCETEKAQEYLKSLKVVYFIAQRVNSTASYFNDRFLEVQTLWEQILAVIPEPLKMTEHDEEITENCSICAVCKTTTSSADLDVDGKRFHSSCANLWVNLIESTLPCT